MDLVIKHISPTEWEIVPNTAAGKVWFASAGLPSKLGEYELDPCIFQIEQAGLTCELELWGPEKVKA